MPSVLLVDDDRDFCTMLSTWGRDKFQLLVAFDGDDALTIAHRCRPDIALVDIMLPRLSGLGLAWAFRHHAALASVPVAFITGYHDVTNAVPEGHPVLQKPFNPAELEALVTELAASRKAAPRDPSTDLRRTERVDVELSATLSRRTERLGGTVSSLSLLGAFFSAEKSLPVGTYWNLSFETERGEHSLPVEVVHNRGQNGTPGSGLSIHDLGLEGERRLQQQLEELGVSAARA